MERKVRLGDTIREHEQALKAGEREGWPQEELGAIVSHIERLNALNLFQHLAESFVGGYALRTLAELFALRHADYPLDIDGAERRFVPNFNRCFHVRL